MPSLSSSPWILEAPHRFGPETFHFRARQRVRRSSRAAGNPRRFLRTSAASSDTISSFFPTVSNLHGAEQGIADLEDLFQLHLTETRAIRNRIMTGLRFLFRVTLRQLDLAAEIYHIKEL